MTGVMVVYRGNVCSVSSLPNPSSIFFLHTEPLHCTLIHHVLHHTVGREVIHYTVVEWLQGSFGCYVTRYGIRRSDLLWMAGVWSGRSCSDPTHSKKEGKDHLLTACVTEVWFQACYSIFLSCQICFVAKNMYHWKFYVCTVTKYNLHFERLIGFFILFFRSSGDIYLSN